MDLSTVTPSLSGPKRPHDRVSLSNMKQDFIDCLNNRVGFKGFGIPGEKQSVEIPFTFDGNEYKLSHGKDPSLYTVMFFVVQEEVLEHAFKYSWPAFQINSNGPVRFILGIIEVRNR